MFTSRSSRSRCDATVFGWRTYLLVKLKGPLPHFSFWRKQKKSRKQKANPFLSLLLEGVGKALGSNMKAKSASV